MRQFTLAALVICASCNAAETDVQRIEHVFSLENPSINEASGLTVSQRDDKLVWTHNDSGSKAYLYAIGGAGQTRARLHLKKSDNDDWEDLASFRVDERPYLLVGDIGDNNANRKQIVLYLVAEPALDDDEKIQRKPDRKITVRYPDGPRDAEALAVDGTTVYILTKRDLPPRLYAVDLGDEANEQTARRLADLVTLPPPTKSEMEFAPKTKSWFWQPTAMDIARDGTGIAILTYEAVYYYARRDAESISDALARAPLMLSIKGIPDAEALTFSADGQALILTVEKKRAPVYRIPLSIPESSQN